MNLPLFATLLFLFQAIYWFVGRKASKNLQTKEDYFLAGKKIRFFPLMMTFLATQVGGGLVLGATDEAYQYGWPVLLYPLGAALGLIFLGAGIGRKLAQFQVSTVAEILEVVYGSTNLKKIASLLSVLSLFMILVAQIIASHKFLFGIGLVSTPLFIAFWAIVILYTVQGGLKAVISTDLVQAIVFSLIFLGSFGFVFFSAPSLPIPAPQWENFELVSSKMCGWLLMPMLFMVIEQDMGQRCFAGGSAKIVSRATFWAGIGTFLICTIPVFFGILAKNIGLQVPAGASVLMAVIEKTTTPWISALVGCAILAAVISTATSLIQAISSNLSNDFKISETNGNLRMGKTITALISMAAILFAFYFDNVVDVLIQSYDLSVSCLFVPIFTALFKKRGNPLSAFLALLLGATSFCLLRVYPFPFPKELLSILFSFLGYYSGEAFTRYQSRALKS